MIVNIQPLNSVTYNLLIKEILFLTGGDTPAFVSIDGRCASGKSTLAEKMSHDIGCPVVHMDDFFLRPEQRTAERYAEAGGNVDRERVWQLLNELKKGNGAEFRVFDCSTMELGETKRIEAAPAYIVEGSYSAHPELRDIYAKTIFLTLDPEIQMERIALRNPDKVEDFRTKWIPYEEKYFEAFRIMETSDVVFDTGLEEVR